MTTEYVAPKTEIEKAIMGQAWTLGGSARSFVDQAEWLIRDLQQAIAHAKQVEGWADAVGHDVSKVSQEVYRMEERIAAGRGANVDNTANQMRAQMEVIGALVKLQEPSK